MTLVRDRRVLVGGLALIGYVLAYSLALLLAPGQSSARTTVADLGLPVLQAVVLAITFMAVKRARGRDEKLVWTLLAIWVGLNLFADSVWAYHEVLLKTEVESPSLADLGYLLSYPIAFTTVFVSGWQTAGRLRAVEATLDATMLTVGIAGLSWPLVLAPLLAGSETGGAYWVTLAYPLGDLIIILAFASLVLGSSRAPLPRHLKILCSAFVVQVIADCAYFAMEATGSPYTAGSWLDSMWTLTFAIAGIAVLMGTAALKGAVSPAVQFATDSSPVEYPAALHVDSRQARAVIPYLGIPIIAAALTVQFQTNGYRWDRDAQILVYLGIGLVILLVCRQYLMLVRDRRLNTKLLSTSRDLEQKISDLAEMTQRLETLTVRTNHLSSLRNLDDVTRSGLDLACWASNSTAGWITLKDDEGEEVVAFTRGPVDPSNPRESLHHSLGFDPTVRAVRLETRGEEVGHIWVANSPGANQGPDLLQMIAAHLATAIDNTRRYEEALELAERDPLTGLLNHGGIYKRLAGEANRAETQGGELSLLMIDLDGFKLLNDTYGHLTGDRVLAEVSNLVRSIIRRSDVAGRIGGDELMLVLPETGTDGAYRLAERLRDTLAGKPLPAPGGKLICPRLSIGIATYPSDASTLAELIETADANLYVSKELGGNRVTCRTNREPDSPDPNDAHKATGRLMNLVGARDRHSRGYSARVVSHALLLGEAVGLSAESMDVLALAAMLHDLSGSSLPTRGLVRRRDPSATEEETETSPPSNRGRKIVRDLSRAILVLEYVSGHQESQGANGRPWESPDEEIALLARVLAISEAYSAMTASRPYQQGLAREQAQIELRRAAGTHLDPELVQKFIDTMDRQSADLQVKAG